MKKTAILFLTALTFLSSCSKDDDNNSEEPSNTSRTLQYNVTGNFSGNLYVTYTTAGGGTTNDQVTAFPWNKEITYNANVTAANIVVTGNGGTAGQQVTLIIKRGGTAVGSPIVSTANSSGSFNQGASPVVF
jgi:hypothetical protein